MFHNLMNPATQIRYPQHHKTICTSTHPGHTMRSILFTLLLLATIPADACVNESYSFEEEYQLNTGQSPVAFLRERMSAQPASQLEDPRSVQAPRPELDAGFIASERDAIRDIYTGSYSTAIEKFLALESAHPGNYSTAANLGTAYELSGDNKSALHWISEGIKRNKDSHHGTEWLHKEILEAKIAMESDPDFLKSNQVMRFNENAAQYSDTYVDSLVRALHFQLGERMLFVKPTDTVVADLLFSFAELEAHNQIPGSAVELLDLAQDYGYHDVEALEERRASYRSMQLWKGARGWARIILYVAGVCAFPALLYFGARFVVRRIERILNTTE